MNIRVRSHLLMLGCLMLWLIGSLLPEAQIYYQVVDTGQSSNKTLQTSNLALSRSIANLEEEYSRMPCPASKVEWFPNILFYGFLLLKLLGWWMTWVIVRGSLLYAEKIQLGLWKFLLIVIVLFPIAMGASLLINNFFSPQTSELVCDTHYFYKIFGVIPYLPTIFSLILGFLFGYLAIYSVSDPEERRLKHIWSRIW